MASLAPIVSLSNPLAGRSTFNETTSEALFLNLVYRISTPSFLCTVLLALLAYRCIKYFTADLPPLGSGLKRLPGPISTLPYVGRAHDVDRNAPWIAMKKFSDQYDGLFSMQLGGSTHIWISREDIAQDLLCKHSAISSARADVDAYPGVAEDYKYLPLMGYTGQC